MNPSYARLASLGLGASLAICVGACTPEFDSIEEACTDRVPGQAGFADSEAFPVTLARQVNCVRRFAGLSRIAADPDLSGASAAHARYLGLHGAIDGDTTSEQASLEGFTGADPIARGEAFGYAWGDALFGYWESALEPSYPEPEAWLSRMLHDPYTRQVLLQPSLHRMGAGNSEAWTVTDWHYTWPPSERARRPILWPIDGATDTPTVSPIPQEDGSTLMAGYAPSVTFGGVSADPDAPNPLGLVLRASSMRGPEGEVQHTTARPERSAAAMPFSLALIPAAPLRADTTYAVSVDVTWDRREALLEWSFTTAPEASDP